LSRTLRIVIVEDSEDDAYLILWELQRKGDSVDFERVETAGELDAALDKGRWDAVISDYRMPRFSGTAALAQVRARDAQIPFILVSATIEPKVEAEARRLGANDCITKQDLRHLLPALLREVDRAAVGEGASPELPRLPSGNP
jgi:CheY-like chemotaxis protein